MPENRLLRILSRLAGDLTNPATTRLCVVCADVTEMSGAGIMLMLEDRPHGSVCTTNDVSMAIEELQYILGEGPGVDAHRQHRPTLEPDLADPAVVRWSAFCGPAEAGARAVFGFPLAVPDVHLGALNLYRDRPGPLTPDQFAEALVLAAVVARSILTMQATADPDTLGPESEIGTNFHLAVHQATGMVSVQLDVPLAEALVRLRAHAYRHDRHIDDVADDVVERRLRFDRSSGDGDQP